MIASAKCVHLGELRGWPLCPAAWHRLPTLTPLSRQPFLLCPSSLLGLDTRARCSLGWCFRRAGPQGTLKTVSHCQGSIGRRWCTFLSARVIKPSPGRNVFCWALGGQGEVESALVSPSVPVTPESSSADDRSSSVSTVAEGLAARTLLWSLLSTLGPGSEHSVHCSACCHPLPDAPWSKVPMQDATGIAPEERDLM